MNRAHLPLFTALAFVSMLAIACAGVAGPALQPVGQGVPTSGNRDEQPVDPADDGESPAAPDGQLIIYTGDMQLDVADLDAAVAEAERVIAGLGGHVAGSRAENRGSSRYATVTYRIPAERWSEALAALRGLASEVVSESTSSQDVTAQVVDLEARLANLRVTETALQSIMDRATTIDDVLEVQRELTKVRGDIESLTAQRDNLAARAALATLTVTFGVPVAAASRASEGWDLGREVDRALAALVRVSQGVVSVAIWLAIVVVPLVVPTLFVVWLAIIVRRRWLAGRNPVQPSV